MKYGAILLLLAAISGRAKAADPMGALQFFVGTWSCIEHQPNKPSVSSTFTFAMESGLLRQWIVRPKQGSMRAPYVVNSTFAYDSTHRRYVQTEMDNEAAWWVSAADSWQGDTLARNLGRRSHPRFIVQRPQKSGQESAGRKPM